MTTANKSDLTITGNAELEIQFEADPSVKFFQKIYIPEEVDDDEILLGIDFLKQHKCIIDLNNNIFKASDLSIALSGIKFGHSDIKEKEKRRCFSQNSTTSKIETEIEEYKKINPKIGNIPTIEHDIK